MTKNEIMERLTPIARDVFMKADLVLSEDSSASTIDTWTSLSFMQFITEIEKKFNFKFKMMEILRLQDVGAIIEAIERHIA